MVVYHALWIALMTSLVFWRRPGGIMGVASIYLSKVFMPIWFITYMISIVLTFTRIETFNLWWGILFFVLNGLLLWFLIHYFRTPDRIPLAALIDMGGYKVWIIVFATIYAILATMGYTGHP